MKDTEELLKNIDELVTNKTMAGDGIKLLSGLKEKYEASQRDIEYLKGEVCKLQEAAGVSSLKIDKLKALKLRSSQLDTLQKDLDTRELRLELKDQEIKHLDERRSEIRDLFYAALKAPVIRKNLFTTHNDQQLDNNGYAQCLTKNKSIEETITEE